MELFCRDILYAFRILFKSPGLTLLAILALSISLGLATTTFSILNGMFLKDLPFDHADRLRSIRLNYPERRMDNLPIPLEMLDSLKSAPCFSHVAGYFSGTINLSGNGLPRRYNGSFISPEFLDLFGIEPFMGSKFTSTPGEMDPPEIMISFDVWKSRYNRDPGIVGTAVRANGVYRQIAGVLPENFHFPGKAQIWIPLDNKGLSGDLQNGMDVTVAARLAEGVKSTEAEYKLNKQLDEWDLRKNGESVNLRLQDFGVLNLNESARYFILVTLIAIVCILFISCANIANLLIGRALARGHELAIRASLGANRRRIICQLLTESLILALFGTIGGLIFAAWAVDFTWKSEIWTLPYWMSFELDWLVFAFATLIMLLTAFASGIMPAWQASKTDLNAILKDSSPATSSFRLGRFTRVLTIFQIAISCALLFGAALTMRHFYKMAHIDPGFEADNVLTMRMGLFPVDYPSESDRDAFYTNVIDNISTIPGIKSASVSSWLGHFGNYKIPILKKKPTDTESDSLHYTYVESVSPSHFETMDLNILRGRGFSEKDHANSNRVGVANQAFVEKFLGDFRALGQDVSLLLNNDNATPSTVRITGITENLQVSRFVDGPAAEPILYIPFSQSDSRFMTLMVSPCHGNPKDALPCIKDKILQLDPHLPIYFVQTFQEFIHNQILPYRMMASMFASIGLMALFLACLSLYGLIAFDVQRRRKEIGIRMALGATSNSIIGLMLRQGLNLVLAGCALGSILAWGIGSLVRHFIPANNSLDFALYSAVLIILCLVTSLAYFIPSRKASRKTPMDALRCK